MSEQFREPIREAIYYAIIDVEGEEANPETLYTSSQQAQEELVRRQALPDTHDDHLSAYHHVFPFHIAGAFWNSFDPDPRAGNPLTAEEIADVYRVE